MGTPQAISGTIEEKKEQILKFFIVMPAVNTTTAFGAPNFVLVCFTSIRSWQHWLSIPLVLLFFVAFVSNITIMSVIQREHALHEPMYYFLSLLAVFDLGLCTATTPKILGILCLDMKVIHSTACFLQMYLMNILLGMESATFLFMAYDRYIAICNPLRYPTVITTSFVAKATVFIVLRNALVILPVPVSAARLQYCSKIVVEHCFCTSAAVTALACNDRTFSTLYQLIVAFGLLGSDLILIVVSYCLILRVVMTFQGNGAAAKAFSTCSSHLILISFFYTVLLVLIFTAKFEKVIPHDVPILLNVLHFLVPPVLNPIVYGVRTTEIKRGIIRMMRNGITEIRCNKFT
ncbi:olfactory receptor 56A4-like [Pleurodeles waltl]|uniref:olfactory receptor 56A4-like n=1 Tax=Pleurodeles waltl TaxID=8319 RepID=UPI003709866E